MEVEQEMGKLRPRQHMLLDPPLGPDEEGAHARIQTHERAGDRQPGIEMSARATAGEQHRDLVT